MEEQGAFLLSDFGEVENKRNPVQQETEKQQLFIIIHPGFHFIGFQSQPKVLPNKSKSVFNRKQHGPL